MTESYDAHFSADHNKEFDPIDKARRANLLAKGKTSKQFDPFANTSSEKNKN